LEPHHGEFWIARQHASTHALEVTFAAESHDTLKVSEIFKSLQGEGASAGQRCAFLRLAGCNLHCDWCDTKYTWDWKNYDYASEVERVTIEQVWQRLAVLGVQRLVVTGGEPLLQQTALAHLLTRIDPSWAIEVETNGTVLPERTLLERITQWNVSPKLHHAGDERARRIVPGVLEAFKETNRAWLKIVIQRPADLEEVEELIQIVGWPRERVLLMPEARSAETLKARAREVAELATGRGLGFTSRLHVELWGGKRGV
jgi:organic radical activating enzyme